MLGPGRATEPALQKGVEAALAEARAENAHSGLGAGILALLPAGCVTSAKLSHLSEP